MVTMEKLLLLVTTILRQKMLNKTQVTNVKYVAVIKVKMDLVISKKLNI